MTLVLAAAASAGERCNALDGNTLICAKDERVRVDGLRQPALHEPGGEEARQRLHRRIQSGELILQRMARDRFGRTLARAYVNGNRVTDLDLSPRSERRTARR
jgi:endonuclease YncB( thermonuclease family)